MSQTGKATSAPDLTLEDVLDLLASRIAAKVAAAQQAAPGQNGVYTTNSPPPGMSRKRFNEICRAKARTDAGVYKVGRVWVAPIEAFVPRPERRAPGAARSDEAWSPEAALASVGVRFTR